MFESFRNSFKKIRFYFRTKWNITDYIIEVNNIIHNVPSPINDSISIESRLTRSDRYLCLTNQDHFCIFIKETDAENILFNNNDIYDKKFNVINVSYLRRYRITKIVIGDVYNKTTPSTVKIKFIETIMYNNFVIYLVYYVDLDQMDPLYNDLLNYNTIKG